MDDTTQIIAPPAYRYNDNFRTMERYRGRERGGDNKEEGAHDEDDVQQSTLAGGVEYRVEYRGRWW